MGPKPFWQELKDKLEAETLGATEPTAVGDKGLHRLQALDTVDDDDLKIMFEQLVHECVPWPFMKPNTK